MVSDDPRSDVAGHGIRLESSRRRTLAIISHPDAGKTTLTESMALHAALIDEAGAVHGKASRRAVVSDWMEIERARGVSIASAALKFDYRGTVINLLDTPGHADFSEDTYRVLTAVDSVIMVIDAAKGVESQTRKLFEVCRRREIPIIAFVNKWDRPGKDPLELLDEIEHELGIYPMPLNWPVGIPGDLRGLLERTSEEMLVLDRVPGSATAPAEHRIAASRVPAEHAAPWAAALEESRLLQAQDYRFDEELFTAGAGCAVLFGAAALNFGVRELLEAVVRLAPPPQPPVALDGTHRPVDGDLSAVVFKLQAGMDRAHRDRLAFIRIYSGKFERGMVLTHGPSGRPFTTKYAHQMVGRDRSTAEIAYPGDVIGLVNASALRIGDTLYVGDPVEYPPMPVFPPEHFAVATCTDVQRQKQFRRGLDQLAEEGVIQLFHSGSHGPQSPIVGAVGPMQFEVLEHRMRHELGAAVTLTPLPYTVLRTITGAIAEAWTREPGVHLARRPHGAGVALFTTEFQAQRLTDRLPHNLRPQQ